MKLGISYNVFDGEELLEGSIKQIRSEVDYISVVYQITSNFGQKCDDNLVPLLNKLKSEGLIDFLYQYDPVLNTHPHYNEITKRNIGLEISKKNGCTHHMSMDCDEYYFIDQFKFLKKEIEDNDFDSSYCQMKTYYKTWDYQIYPPEDYFVSLIYKINPNEYFGQGRFCPVTVDPTRQMSSGKYRILNREEIEMHHGSYIRNDIRKKFENSSASGNFRNDINRLIDEYNNWEYPKPVLMAGLPSMYQAIKKVETLFK